MIKKIALIIFAILGLVLSFGSEGAYDTTFSFDGEEHPKVTLSHMSWDDSFASSAVIANVLRDEGFEVDLIQLDPAIVFSSLAAGSSDFTVSPWMPVTHGSYVEEYGEQIDIMGPHTEGAKVAFVVPAYMEDINSIEDLTTVADQTITGIEPGSGIAQQGDEAMAAYSNLSDWEHQKSSSGAMLTSLRQAYNNQEEIVITGWTPHWMFIEFDLKVLEDPKNVFGAEEDLVTMARQGFAEDNPVAYQIIDNFYWELEDIQQVMLYMQDDMSPDEAARVWMEDNPDKVAEWTGEEQTE